ncbi:MAG: phospho-N-acetylmuramoyl-pentapeptide-transferase [Candidatus Aminicenantes bacterium]|nr:MAG: phospho-N-acetylmuramoyl-pentapeptide-transferase [Candidatus Aminicenantes bacterium]
MSIWLMEFLADIPGHRLVTYITFRALMAMLTAFLVGVLSGRKIITIIYQLNFRDTTRDYGDISPRNKEGTPTMGGIIIFLSFLISVLLWGKLDNFFLRVILFAGFWFTALGFFDDYLKSVRGSSDAGMSRGLKLIFQILFGVILGLLVLTPGSTPFPKDMVTQLFVPFFKNPVMDLSFFYYPFVVVVIIGISNSINFADGLDGLATVPVSFLAVVYAAFAYILGNSKLSEYFLFPYMNGSGELVIVMAALIGALAAFLWFNTYPAEIFMGDTGSLFLGGVIATTAILLKKEVLFLIAGGVFVVEFLSVFIQDYIGIKWFKRRIFYRAPVHHTFQFLGIAEPKIVVRFWIIAALFTLISLISIKLR